MANDNKPAARGAFLTFFDLVTALLEGKWLIVGLALVCGAVAAGVSLLLPNTFEASSVLVLMPPPLRETRDETTGLLPKVVGVKDYEVLLHSDGLLMQVAEKIRGLGTWSPEDLEAIDRLSALSSCLRIEIDEVQRSVNGTQYSLMIVLKAQADSGEHARDLAQTWAEVAQQASAELATKGNSGMRSFLDGRFQTSKGELYKVMEDLRLLETKYDDELEKKRLSERFLQLLELEKLLEDHKSELAQFRAELAEIETRLASEPERIVLWKSPPMTAVFLEEDAKKAGKAAGEAGKDAVAGYKEEVVNEIYTTLQKKKDELQTKIKGLEEMDRQLGENKQGLEDEIQRMREEIGVNLTERRRLDLQSETFTKSYGLLATKLEQAKIAEMEQAGLADLKLVSKAVAPDRKVAPKRAYIAISSTLLGAVIACMLAVVRYKMALGNAALRADKQTRTAEAGA